MDAIVGLAHRALDLGMTLVTDHDHIAPVSPQFGHFDMDLGDQRTGGVEDLKAASAGLVAHRPRHAVGRENHGGAIGNVGQIIDEDRAFSPQITDHMVVVNDFMPNIDWRAELTQRPLDDFDRAVDAGTKAARLGQQRLRHRVLQLAHLKGLPGC